jgi:hypothetical protein
LGFILIENNSNGLIKVMPMFNKKDHQQILEEARDTLERLKNERPPPSEIVWTDPVERWREQSNTITAARETEKAKMSAREPPPQVDLSATIDQRVEATLTREFEAMIRALSEQFIELLDAERASINQALQQRCHELEEKTRAQANQILSMRERALSNMNEINAVLVRERDHLRAMVRNEVDALTKRASVLESKLSELLGTPKSGEIVDLTSFLRGGKNMN